MATLSVISWNIEHFNGGGGIDKKNRAKRRDRVERVAQYLKDESPDVFGLSEVEGKTVFDKFTTALPNYSFSITEGDQSQEILIGVKSGLSAFFTQRNEFKRNNPYLRPGALLTITKETAIVPILFLHLKSMPSPEGFGLRDAMFENVFGLKKALDKAAAKLHGGPSNFIVLGDMNTMGMNYEGKEHDIPHPEEVRIVKTRFGRRKMRALAKSHTATFNNGSGSKFPESDLDHVFAAKHMTFTKKNGHEVIVGGWAALDSTAKRDKWIEEFSDHAPLKFKLTGL
jgi:endonuclease/exonuclease/phosphatase family metal-dependent hydrolase